MSKKTVTSILKEQCPQNPPVQIKMTILTEQGRIWIQPEGFGEKNAMDNQGWPIGIEIWQGSLRVLLFDDINSEDPLILTLDNAKETCRLDNDPMEQRSDEVSCLDAFRELVSYTTELLRQLDNQVDLESIEPLCQAQKVVARSCTWKRCCRKSS